MQVFKASDLLSRTLQWLRPNDEYSVVVRHVHTLFTGSHYDIKRRNVRLSLYSGISLQITHLSQERLATLPAFTSPTLFEQWCGFFSILLEPDTWECCETRPTVFCPYPRRLESLTVCLCHYKGSTVFSVISVKNLSVGPTGVWTRDPPLSRPKVSQLS